MARPTTEQLKQLWEHVTNWRDEHNVTCPEALMQVDSVNESLPELAEVLLDTVGYAEE
jgi:hypothetical protein